jgi:hypothetical protein
LTGSQEVTSPSLRKALGWDRGVPIPIVVEQFKHIVASSDPSSHSRICLDLRRLIHELGSRSDELGDDVVQDLRAFTADRVWVPTSGSTLSSAFYAVFSLSRSLPLFRRIESRLRDSPNSTKFLKRMGCAEESVFPLSRAKFIY